MKVDAHPQSMDEYTTARLDRYEESWRIWRAENRAGQPSGWCATRRDGSAGEPMTIVRDTAAHLAVQLGEDARRQELAAEYERDPGGA